jgi:hypothetical protein
MNCSGEGPLGALADNDAVVELYSVPRPGSYCIALTGMLLVSDLGLMFFVTCRAAILVIASVVLLFATIRFMRSVPDTPW